MKIDKKITIAGPRGLMYGVELLENGTLIPFKGDERGEVMKTVDFIMSIGTAASECVTAVIDGTANHTQKASALRSFAWAFREKERQERKIDLLNHLFEVQPCGWGNARREGAAILADHEGLLFYRGEWHTGKTTCQVAPPEDWPDRRDIGCYSDGDIFNLLNYKPYETTN